MIADRIPRTKLTATFLQVFLLFHISYQIQFTVLRTAAGTVLTLVKGPNPHTFTPSI